MTARITSSLVVFGLASTLATSAGAQTACEPSDRYPGVRDAAAVSMFMTGVRHADGLRVGRVSYRNYSDIVPRAKTVALAAFQPVDLTVEANGRPPQRVLASFASSSYFDVMGASLQLGRAFTSSDDAPGQTALTAVISDRVWESLFDRNPAAVGQTVTVNGQAAMVVGVAGPAFRGARSPRFEEHLWLPGVTLPAVNQQPGLRSDDRASGGYYLFTARLKKDATWADAHAELAALTKWLAETYPAANGKFWEVGFHDFGPLACASR